MGKTDFFGMMVKASSLLEAATYKAQNLQTTYPKIQTMEKELLEFRTILAKIYILIEESKLEQSKEKILMCENKITHIVDEIMLITQEKIFE